MWVCSTMLNVRLKGLTLEARRAESDGQGFLGMEQLGGLWEQCQKEDEEERRILKTSYFWIRYCNLRVTEDTSKEEKSGREEDNWIFGSCVKKTSIASDYGSKIFLVEKLRGKLRNVQFGGIQWASSVKKVEGFSHVSVRQIRSGWFLQSGVPCQ